MICIRHIDVEKVDTSWLLHVEAWLDHMQIACATSEQPTQYGFALYFASAIVEQQPPVDFQDLEQFIYDLNSNDKLDWEIINPNDY